MAESNPNDPSGANSYLKVTDLSINAVDAETVALRWSNPGPEGSQGVNPEYACFRVEWRPLDGVVTRPEDEGSIVVGDCETSHATYTTLIPSLRPTLYRFIVRPIERGSRDYRLEPARYADTNDGAPGVRHTTDAARPGERLRLYELGSDRGDALYLDPAGGGPTRLISATAPQGTLQLVLLPEGPGIRRDYFRIAAAHLTEYAATGRCDTTVGISGLQSGDSLSRWYVYTYEGLPFTDWAERPVRHTYPEPGENNSGHVVRIGDPAGSSFRYIRLAILGEDDGTILRGQSPHRYIEVEVCIGFPGVPFG